MGGEKCIQNKVTPPESGSPPRGRGKALGSMKSESRRGITPAWAGKSIVKFSLTKREGDHPRVGGEKLIIRGVLQVSVGSPPRGRGKGNDPLRHCRQAWITPAWAGKSFGDTFFRF